MPQAAAAQSRFMGRWYGTIPARTRAAASCTQMTVTANVDADGTGSYRLELMRSPKPMSGSFKLDSDGSFASDVINSSGSRVPVTGIFNGKSALLTYNHPRGCSYSGKILRK
jgi:hypothetical protein